MDPASTLAILAHELRSPVAALAAIAETLSARSDEIAADDTRRLAELAIRAAHDIERIVLDATPGSLRRQTVDVSDLVQGAVEAATVAGAPVRLASLSELSRLDIDPVRVRQALANLIANAVAHSPAGEEVVVSATEVDGHVRITVTDRGGGIAPADQERVFEPGVRLSERPGRGLGLAVARAVAEAHGGALEVVSAPGEGAAFTLDLPTGDAESA